MFLVTQATCCKTADSVSNISIKNEPNKIKFVTSINLLHVSAPRCHFKGFFEITVIQSEHPNLDYLEFFLFFPCKKPSKTLHARNFIITDGIGFRGIDITISRSSRNQLTTNLKKKSP